MVQLLPPVVETVAERNTLTRNGGNGGDGQVIVSYDYPNGLCMPVAAYNALPDNGCITNNNRVIPVEISGLPTTLGTNPGNARLESVEVIVSHTWNRDIHISLTSPSFCRWWHGPHCRQHQQRYRDLRTGRDIGWIYRKPEWQLDLHDLRQ